MSHLRLLSKRANFTKRFDSGGDPTLKLDELLAGVNVVELPVP
jgi:hypothetical protein